jgi:hypothetical protein
LYLQFVSFRIFKSLLVFCLLSLILSSFVIERTDEPVTIKSPFDKFNVDHLGNVYLVHEEELLKFLPNGKLFARYSNLKLGEISGIDVNNPLKIVLYYHDFQQVVFLDNQLSSQAQPLALEKLGLEQAQLVCGSVNNSLWIYNRQNNELLRFNENMQRIAATGNLKQVLQRDVEPKSMIEHNNFLYLNSKNDGLFVFDMFGTFNKIISLKELQDFYIANDLVYFNRDSSICSYNFKTFEEICTTVDDFKQLRSIQFRNNHIYRDLKDSLVISPLSEN